MEGRFLCKVDFRFWLCVLFSFPWFFWVSRPWPLLAFLLQKGLKRKKQLHLQHRSATTSGSSGVFWLGVFGSSGGWGHFSWVKVLDVVDLVQVYTVAPEDGVATSLPSDCDSRSSSASLFISKSRTDRSITASVRRRVDGTDALGFSARFRDPNLATVGLLLGISVTEEVGLPVSSSWVSCSCVTMRSLVFPAHHLRLLPSCRLDSWERLLLIACVTQTILVWPVFWYPLSRYPSSLIIIIDSPVSEALSWSLSSCWKWSEVELSSFVRLVALFIACLCLGNIWSEEIGPGFWWFEVYLQNWPWR